MDQIPATRSITYDLQVMSLTIMSTSLLNRIIFNPSFIKRLRIMIPLT